MVKTKATNLSYKDFLTDSYVTSRDFRAKKNILVRSSSDFKSSLQHADTSNSKRPFQGAANITSELCSMYWQRHKS